MTKRKTPPNGDGASPNNVRVSAKLPRKTMHKFMYHVQGLDQEGKVIRSRLYTREYAAMEYAENLLNYCHGITPYIQAHELLPLHSYSHWAMPKGIYLSRREAEISIFGYSDIPAGER